MKTKQQKDIEKILKIKGIKYISQDKQEEWNDYVEQKVNDTYDGQDCLIAIEFIRMIDNGNNLDVKFYDDILSKRQDLSGNMVDSIRAIICKFSERGEEYKSCLDAKNREDDIECVK